MLTAAINSSTEQTSVALIEGKKLLQEKTWKSSRDEAEKILPALAALLKKEKKQWRDVSTVFVVTGPGPFTGLRVGVTIANALALGLGCRLKTVNVFEYLRARIPQKLVQKTAVVIKGGGEYVAVLLPQAKKEKLLKKENITGVLQKQRPKYLLCGMKNSEAWDLRKMLMAAGMKIKSLAEKDLKPFGKTFAGLAAQARKTAKLAEPQYLQKPHITQSKKEVFARK